MYLKNIRIISSFISEEKNVEKAIIVDDVSMRFNLATERVDNLKEYIVRKLKFKSVSFDEFWALRDISFTVNKGESCALIGVNGSGKSTMLKIISGILKPTKGKVTVNGSIAPLIELGAGFDFDLTGRENIFLNGAILGHSKKLMQEKYSPCMKGYGYNVNNPTEMIKYAKEKLGTYKIDRPNAREQEMIINDYSCQDKAQLRKKIQYYERHSTDSWIASHEALILERAEKMHSAEAVANKVINGSYSYQTSLTDTRISKQEREKIQNIPSLPQ